MTLLFATFVVLYALSQIDISEFGKLEDSIKKAFNAPSLLEGADSL
ncbi:flagellar motor protein MotD, partial [bacterium]|nr:flagellar motor protein MotD [bacterium]